LALERRVIGGRVGAGFVANAFARGAAGLCDEEELAAAYSFVTWDASGEKVS
jgi:hypothetical protein